MPMPEQRDIRRLDRQGVPHAEIARGLHVDRSTVAGHARMEDCTPGRPGIVGMVRRSARTRIRWTGGWRPTG